MVALAVKSLALFAFWYVFLFLGFKLTGSPWESFTRPPTASVFAMGLGVAIYFVGTLTKRPGKPKPTRS